ncbi:MAG: tryptophan synthase subunit alpha [Desulfovibrionaceae bacterium]|nr:tryptophan synthase subunit alpha [Desulfovibrionaceae bacterium]
MKSSLLTEKIRAANASGRIALIPFLPAGFPDKDRFWEELAALDAAGADIIEIGMPFSDPVADGPVVERASLQALAQGVDLAWILGELAARRAGFSAALVLMGYLNPVLQYGVAAFARDASRAGVSGVILADLPFEEAVDIKAVLTAQGLDLVPLVGLNTSRERLAMYAAQATGFAYFVSVLGTTGERRTLPEEVRQKLAVARQVFDIPVALGFGLKTPDQLKGLEGLVDAAVFGSALIKHLEAGGKSAEFMAAWS